jgi:hypothetical protein
MADYTKAGKSGAARRKYMIELVGERMCDYAVERFVSGPMQRGLDLEPAARDAYEAHTGRLAAPASWVIHPSIEWAGATPDGFLDDDGLIEIKVPQVSTYVEWLAGGVIPEQHVGQMTMQLACTARRYVDFVAYCPELKDRGLFIRRFSPDAEAIANCEATVRAFLKEVDALFEQVTTTPVSA